MALTLSNQPAVVELGGATEERYAYQAAATIGEGSLIRINTAGTISVALASAAGAVSGIALAAATTGEDIPVLIFKSDTIVKMSAIDAVVPATSLIKGSEYTLEIGTNQFGVTATETSGVALIMDYADTGKPWSEPTTNAAYNDVSTDAGASVLVRFTDVTLSGTAAA